MAKKIGQILYNGKTTYLDKRDLKFGTTQTTVGNTNFDDLVINLINGKFVQGTTYYLRLNIKRININDNYGVVKTGSDNDPHYQNIECKLYSDDNLSYQTLGELLVIEPYQSIDASSVDNEGEFLDWCEERDPETSMSTGAKAYYDALVTRHNQDRTTQSSAIRTNKQVVELIFTPYLTSSQIVFELRRVAYDYSNSTSKRIVAVDTGNDGYDYDAAIIKNILPHTCDKIGIQTTPGSLVIINGEGMRVGKSGIMEINSGIAINSVGFAAPNREINNFILDYIYTE